MLAWALGSSSADEVTKGASVGLLVLFWLPVLLVALSNPEMFLKRYGRRHRLCGILYLFLLVVGAMEVPLQRFNHFLFDVVLSLAGLTLTLTAAFDFKRAHERVKNVASGALEDSTTISYSEMIEHSFYQLLNLVQIVYLHLFELEFVRESGMASRLALAIMSATPWLFRGRFPFNRFSDNYSKGQDAWSLISVLYRLKKYQYVTYKHFLLFGLNLTVAVENTSVTESLYFRLYWICLNAAYVMEFFLQTLVKRRYM